MRIATFVAAAAIAVSTAAPAQVAPSAKGAAAVVDMFHAALRRGDPAGAQRLLSPDALIYEAGGAERSRAEYASHHLPADAAFAKAVETKMTRRSGHAAGNLAWVASEGVTSGTFRGRAINNKTTETMVLRRAGGGWKIVHIHWSSAKQ